MKPAPVDIVLGPGARSELSLRAGDSVLVRVIKRLAGNKWAVGIRGQVLPAFSELELAAGQRLKAQVAVRHGRVTLKVSGEAQDAIRELLLRQGMRPDPFLETIVKAFLGSGLSVAPERLQAARRLLQKLKLDPRKFARILAVVLEKGMDLRSRGLEQLLSILGYGEQESGGQRRRRRRMSPDAGQLARQLQSEVEQQQGEQGSSLQVFNHLQGEHGGWVVIPFDYKCNDSDRIYGTIRLHHDPRRRQTDRLVVVARVARDERGASTTSAKEENSAGSESGGKWSFVLHGNVGAPGSGDREAWRPRQPASGPSGPAAELTIFHDSMPAGGDRGRRIKAELDVLRSNLQNLGVKTDDTIREDQSFNGFDLPWEELSYQSVDTVH
jgi:hypothetical protein